MQSFKLPTWTKFHGIIRSVLAGKLNRIDALTVDRARPREHVSLQYPSISKTSLPRYEVSFRQATQFAKARRAQIRSASPKRRLKRRPCIQKRLASSGRGCGPAESGDGEITSIWHLAVRSRKGIARSAKGAAV
jgi:hypothetical protein